MQRDFGRMDFLRWVTSFLVLPYTLLNLYLNVGNETILEYFLSRLSYLTFACLFGAMFLEGEVSRYKKVIFLLLCLFLWKLPSLIIENFALGFFTFSLTNLLMPYGFNFSIFGGEGNLYSSFVSLFIFVVPILIFSSLRKIFTSYAKTKIITIFSLLSILFASSGKYLFLRPLKNKCQKL